MRAPISARTIRIAAAIGGTMIAFGWISNKRKSWPKPEKAEKR